jgi:hypothetical protein
MSPSWAHRIPLLLPLCLSTALRGHTVVVVNWDSTFSVAVKSHAAGNLGQSSTSSLPVACSDDPRWAPPNCRGGRFYLPPVWLDNALLSYVAPPSGTETIACWPCQPATRVAGTWEGRESNPSKSYNSFFKCTQWIKLSLTPPRENPRA